MGTSWGQDGGEFVTSPFAPPALSALLFLNFPGVCCLFLFDVTFHVFLSYYKPALCLYTRRVRCHPGACTMVYVRCGTHVISAILVS